MTNEELKQQIIEARGRLECTCNKGEGHEHTIACMSGDGRDKAISRLAEMVQSLCYGVHLHANGLKDMTKDLCG